MRASAFQQTLQAVSYTHLALAEKEIQLSGYWLERISGTLASFDVKSEDMKKALLTALGYFTAVSYTHLIDRDELLHELLTDYLGGE